VFYVRAALGQALLVALPVTVWCQVVALILQSRLLRQLKSQHPDIFISLGSPSIVFNSTIDNRHRLATFLRDNEYAPLKDPILDSPVGRRAIANRRATWSVGICILPVLLAISLSVTHQ